MSYPDVPSPDLNARQREAVLHLDGPCMVLAGAGSGKTRVITQKIAYLLRECGYDARRVVALTFTNKAAREMQERLKSLVEPRRSKGITVSTFHALGLRFLREEAGQLGLKRNFSILDANDALGIVQELTSSTDKGLLRSVLQTISLWKNALVGPAQAMREAQTPAEIQAARVYESYCATLSAYQAVDFDDLIRLPTELLMRDEDTRRRWQTRVHYLLVDEYQDTNVCQYRFLQALVGDRAMFTVVGDDDQAIYAWRGATVENLATLSQDYPALRLIKLEQNYRSVQRILQAANVLIRRNPSVFGKTLWSDLGMGEPIQVTPMENEEKEAESIAMHLSASRFERRAEWRDFAVLYRSNHQARLLEQALRNLRIPYVLSGGQSFFDKAEIRDIMAYLRLIANDDDDPAFIRAATTPKRGIGQATLQTLGQFAAARQCSLFEAVFEIGQTEQLAARQLEPLRVFVTFIQRMQTRAGRAPGGRAMPPPAGQSLPLDLTSVDAPVGDWRDMPVGDMPVRDVPARDGLAGGMPAGSVPAWEEAPAGSAAPAGPAADPAQALARLAIDGREEDSTGRVLDDLLRFIQYERYLYDTLDERQAQSRWQNVLELTSWLKRKGDEDGMTLMEVAQHVLLVSMLEREDEEAPDAVKLSTLHASKGLEFPHVYLAGVEEGLLPHLGRDDEVPAGEAAASEFLAARIQEERRLMYVGITRAQRSLRLSWCRKRRRGRDEASRERSRFVEEMELGEQPPPAEADAPASPRERLDRLKALLGGKGKTSPAPG